MKLRSLTCSLACLIGVASLSVGMADAEPRHAPFDSHRDHDHRTAYSHSAHTSQRGHDSNHRSSTMSCSCNGNGGTAIRLVAGGQRGKPQRPDGWHSREWFQRRGYNLDNYAHMHRDGTVHHGRNLRR